ncbi:hypothetical protein EYF80_009304 [Liparis tanakae]|uniref:Uncharacterized protein n=1 Tax=Liparis tanakae TaxID=230148 RepID=A0A4Z2ISS8_9TELE|nr:hypothetical protein EYF80_009304 [Liparis tanakae]
MREKRDSGDKEDPTRWAEAVQSPHHVASHGEHFATVSAVAIDALRAGERESKCSHSRICDLSEIPLFKQHGGALPTQQEGTLRLNISHTPAERKEQGHVRMHYD